MVVQNLILIYMTETKPLILISNDDGVQAKGINELVEVAKKLGEVVIVAPDKGMSAKSHAVTMTEPLQYKRVEREDTVESYACTGTPADSVKMAIHQILERKPDLVISGINHGSNASISVVYSGTFAAALEGSLNGVPSIAFSLLDYSVDADFSASKIYAEKIIANALKNPFPSRTCLNVNIPKATVNEVKGMRVCRQTKGAWAEKFIHREHPYGADYYWLTGKYQNFEPEAEDTDEWALNNNYVSIVPIKLDWTDYETISNIKDWE